MKQKIFIATIFFISLTSCEDYLDKAPEMGLTEEDVFLEYESARGFLDQNYDMLEDFHNWDTQDLRNANMTSLSDETATNVEITAFLELNAGQWLDQPSKGEVGWVGGSGPRSPIIQRAFAALRVSNKVIANAEMIPNLSQEELDGLLGQAYFLRGWWYFQIITRWGGMPIFDRVYSPSENLDMPRLTYQESTEWLISDMEKAIELLPHRWDDIQYGRATKGSAYGLRSMAALYAASPLMKNGLNTIQNNGYDIPWAERAAEYAHEAIEYVQSGTGGHRYRLMNGDEYNNIFYYSNYGSDEALWFKQNAGARSIRDIRSLYLPRRINDDGGQGHSAVHFSNPTQNIVDKFETLDGYPISHPASGYNPQDPYANRDPRLTNNIILPGEEWGLNNANKPLYLETYVGGRDYRQAERFNVSSSRMLSGYANKKFIWPEANGYTEQYNLYTYNHVYIRVSQLYLDFAEAMNEAYGPNSDPKGYGMTAVQAINIIRNRVGMPNVLNEFTGTKEAFRERIRNERAVELMFEHPHRWNDIRRWMIAEELFSEPNPIYGMRAYPDQPGPGPVEIINYEVVPLTPEQRVFETRHYWYPVAQDHVENLINFQQNPGW